MKKKALAFAAMACSVAMLLSACGGSNSNAASGDTAGSNIITAYNSEPQNPLIPGNTNETGGGKPVDLLFSRLVSFDKDGKASNEVAESITPNDDATQYTIKIKSGWKFTDGTPVTAESFTKAWSYVANAKNAQKCSSFFSAIVSRSISSAICGIFAARSSHLLRFSAARSGAFARNASSSSVNSPEASS